MSARLTKGMQELKLSNLLAASISLGSMAVLSVLYVIFQACACMVSWAWIGC